MEWQEKKIGDLLKVERGGSPRPINEYITEFEDGINWIKIGDTVENSMYITKTKQKIKPEGLKKSRYVQVGDFLLSNSMSFGRPYILKIDGCIHDGWLVLRDEKDVFDKRFLYYLLGSSETYKRFQNMAVGGVVNNLNSAMVRELSIIYPTKNMQGIIADILDTAKSLIDKRKEQIEECDELIKSRFVEMFGDPVTNSKSLPVIQLGEACYMKAGKGIKACDIIDEFEEGSYPCYGGNGLRGYVKEYTHEGNIPLVGRQGALCGNVQYATGKFYATEHAVITQTKLGWNAGWLFIMLREMNLNRLASGAAQPGLNVGTLIPLEVINPPIDLQNEFATFVKQANNLKFVMQQSLTELENSFNAIMQKAFKGELFSND